MADVGLNPDAPSGGAGSAEVPATTAACLPALHDALDSATSAALAAQGGDQDRMELALLEASSAAVSAFPAGSPEAEALSVIFTAIGRAAVEAGVPPGVPPADLAGLEPWE